MERVEHEMEKAVARGVVKPLVQTVRVMVKVVQEQEGLGAIEKAVHRKGKTVRAVQRLLEGVMSGVEEIGHWQLKAVHEQEKSVKKIDPAVRTRAEH